MHIHVCVIADYSMVRSNAFGRKVFGQVEENHEVWKAAGRLVGHESGTCDFGLAVSAMNGSFD